MELQLDTWLVDVAVFVHEKPSLELRCNDENEFLKVKFLGLPEVQFSFLLRYF